VPDRPAVQAPDSPSGAGLPDSAPKSGAAGRRPRTVSSTELLGDDGLLGIEHEGELYILRRTRNGRLILTK